VFVACRGGDLIGSVTVVWSDPFIWRERDAPAGYIHMLMVDRAYAHLGIGRALLDWAEQRIVATGHCSARLDCVRSNLGLRSYYEQAGYGLVGNRDFNGLSSVALYEKSLCS
jgi:GNAT superfamily N-acetyltransferase